MFERYPTASLRLHSLCWLFSLFLIFFASCKGVSEKQNAPVIALSKDSTLHRVYSQSVGDSFSIFVSLPKEYGQNNRMRYPVVYVLDANVYFDVFKAIVDKYSEVGLAPQVILVGVGYRDLNLLDSLRSRDFTFPIADPKYEMAVSGGADRFLAFLTRDLVPQIDRAYRTDTARRTLFGHSLGGYFVSYVLMKSLEVADNPFQDFIAASPSLNYNHYYLVDQLKKLAGKESNGQKEKLFLSYGSLEDEEDEDDPEVEKVAITMKALSILIGSGKFGGLQYKSVLYSNLAHMDTPIISFLQGMQWLFPEEEKK